VFVIPYQELLEYFKERGEDYPDNLILDVEEFEKYFKGMANFISTPVSISILKKALVIIEEINRLRREDPKLDEFLRCFRPNVMKIDEFPDKITRTIAELERREFKYPGLPALLFYLGVNNAYTTYLELWKQRGEEGEEELFRSLKVCVSNKTEKPEYGIIKRVLNKFDAMREKLARFLLEYGIYYDLTSVKIEEIKNQVERGFIDDNELISNPYSIIEDMKEKEGVEPIRFDEIDYWERRRLGKNFDPYDPHRIRALLVAILKRALELGHTSISVADLRNYFERLDTNISFDEFLRLIERNEELIKEKVDVSEEIIEGESLRIFTLKEVRESERAIEETVNFLVGIERPQLNIGEGEIRTILEDKVPDGVSKEEYEKALREQIDAVRGLLEYRVGILTGPAGCGKTHVIKALVTLMKEKEGFSNILVLTPTGKSAIRIREVLQNLVEPKTIHRFIAQEMREYFDFDYFVLGEVPEFKKKRVDAIIIDEASMVDTLLLGGLLSVIKKGSLKRLIFVGDVNQLPPVDAGKPFYDLYQYLERSKVGYIAKLNTVLRASSKRIVEFSRIFLSDTSREDKEHVLEELFSSRQVHGEEEKYSIKDGTKEVVTIRVVKDVKRTLEEVIEELLKENELTVDDFFKFMVFEDRLQILTPTRTKGEFSSYKLGLFIRQDSKFVPDRYKEKLVRNVFFGDNRVADKIIQTKNNYNKYVYDIRSRKREKQGVFNGMMGYVVTRWRADYRTNRRRPETKVRFYFPEIETYPLSEEMEYAYVITIHKSQGSGFENVLVVIPKGLDRFLSREMIYTAITRAESRLYVIVEESISNLLNVSNSDLLQRKTHLFGNPIDPRALPENLRIITLNGERVRSWQECLLANLFREAGIKYQYEPLSEYLNIGVYPDFKLLLSDRIMLWEHYGMIEDESYLKRQREKEEIYKRAGFQILRISDIVDNIEFGEKVLVISTPEDLKDNRTLLEKLNLLKTLAG